MATFWITFCIVLYAVSGPLIECHQRILSYTNVSYGHHESVNFTSIIKDGAISSYLTTYTDTDNFIIDLDLYVKTSDSATLSELSKTSTDICKILRDAGSNIFISVVMEHMRKSKQNKIFRKCPVLKVCIFDRAVIVSLFHI